MQLASSRRRLVSAGIGLITGSAVIAAAGCFGVGGNGAGVAKGCGDELVDVTTPARWNWLQGTYWYVAPEGLPALRYDPATGTPTAVSDQTVYYIREYKNGYFWGDTVIQMVDPNSDPPGPIVLTRTLLGSVTPEGALQLSFLPAGPTGPARATNGIGVMQCKGNAWTMENQMATGTTATIVHWAYMQQCRPGEACNDRLPGTTLSLPEFMAQVTTTD